MKHVVDWCKADSLRSFETDIPNIHPLNFLFVSFYTPETGTERI